MKKNYFLLFSLLLIGFVQIQGQNPIDFVNPFIGTDGHGHTFPGASMPFGMVQLSPDTRKDNWDACSGYHYSDSVIYGFSHTHLSGTGVGDYGDVRLMPMSGKLDVNPGNESEAGYRSSFSHNNEKASPGYYKVYLDDYKINAELTVTKRCGMHQYTFSEPGKSFILVDLTESVVTEHITDLFINIISDHEICGYRRTAGWAEDQVIYFFAEFSEPFESRGIFHDGQILNGLDSASGKDIKAFAGFNTSVNDVIQVKVGLSAVGIEGAKNNLIQEMPGWDFNALRVNAENEWKNVLGKIEVEGGSSDDKIKFYSALYHCYLAPNLFSDFDGKYRGHDGLIHQSSRDVYTVFSLWDTYRALHPLMTILEPEKTADFIQTFLNIYEQGGLLPVWELAGNETFCMIGYHAVPVIVDAYLKGIRNFDAGIAFSSMKNSAEKDLFGLKFYRENGYIPAEAEGESVSKTLEYAYDDWCIAMMASSLGKEEDYKNFIERAQFYKNIFDPETRFLRGKRNGMFTEPFDPTEVNFMLTEANTWQYTFYVPQDISGLQGLMGGHEAFEKKLDEMFNAPTDLSGRQQSDITGLIGQYAHGNEPSHHMAYLYNYVQRPDKTQKLVRQIMDDLYGPGPDGLCGNEDCGQMSAWFVMSAMGLYPVTPGIGYYAIGSPLFNEIRIKLNDGKKFTITADHNNYSYIYIQSASLNGVNYSRSFLEHQEIVNGGVLSFTMGAEPLNGWGSGKNDSPVSSISEYLITPVPFFQAKSSSFQDSITINIRHINPESSIYFKEDLTISKSYELFNGPVKNMKSISLSAFAVLNSTDSSKVTGASFYQIHNDWTISITNPYSAQYTGGGDLGLIDGQRGGPNFRTGSWQGYQGVDFEAIIDIGKAKMIHKVSVTFLQDQRSWIFMPERLEVFVSNDGSDYRQVAVVQNDVADNLADAVIKMFTSGEIDTNARYIKVKGVNRGICPAWHVGAGDKAWIFVDEITVE